VNQLVNFTFLHLFWSTDSMQTVRLVDIRELIHAKFNYLFVFVKYLLSYSGNLSDKRQKRGLGVRSSVSRLILTLILNTLSRCKIK